MTTPFKLCAQCIFFIKNKSCSVFSNIPDIIWSGKNDHKKPYKGDKGITFESIKVKRS